MGIIKVKKMKILFGDRFNVGNLAGETVHIYEIISQFSRMGHETVLLSGNIISNQMKISTKPAIPHREKAKIRIPQWLMSLPFRSELSLLGLFGDEAVVFISILIIILKTRGKLDIIYRRHGALNTEYVLAKLCKIPLIKEVNGIVADEVKSTAADRFYIWVIEHAERFTLPKADKLIVVTAKLKKVLQEDFGVSADKITVISNGANTDLFKPMDTTKARAEVGLDNTKNYICFVGKFFPWQGIEYLIQSLPIILEYCPNTMCLVVGDGLVKEKIVDLAMQLEISKSVIFTGMIPYYKVPFFINSSDVCLGSFAKDARNQRIGASSLKIYEYMACARPVIATKMGGLEMLEDNSAGILVEPANPQAIAAAAIRLLQNRELRKQMGENGRRYVLENQSWASVAKKVSDICQSVIYGKSKRYNY
jgi:glycosyltransferase involved in cell wall biosynthesis